MTTMSGNSISRTDGNRFRRSGRLAVADRTFAARILVADDEQGIRRAASRALERCGYSVLQAANGAEALARLTEHGAEIDLVLADVSMPLLGGLELRRLASRQGVTSRFLFISGRGGDDLGAEAGGTSDAFLAKPWTVDKLVEQVRELLAPACPK
jgi:CheY-like chemotaxis protein